MENGKISRGAGQLHSLRMPRRKAPAVVIAPIRPPARAFISVVARRVETQSGHLREAVSIARIDRDPAPAPRFPVGRQFMGSCRRGQGAGVVKKKRNGTRAIVTVLVKRSVPATPHLGLPHEKVARPDRPLHRFGRIRRRISDAAPDDCPVPRHDRTSRWRSGGDIGSRRRSRRKRWQRKNRRCEE